MFGGSKDIDNLVAQSKFINRPFKENGDWYNLEKEWKEMLKEGGDVKNIKVSLTYEGNSQRPTEFLVEYIISGKEKSMSIKNI